MHHSGTHQPSRLDFSTFCEKQKTTKSVIMRALRAKPSFYKGYKVEYKVGSNIPLRFIK